ncbi:DEAD/DEAH box helicase [Candidatus Accumulibacter phosphatis]|uniref:DEAD/DEAH box helicase n=1 Tax=Candidatus Accumulibacter contiguus TaxID=2954381 RepID=A0ABX1TAZ7_9PROT|nr:DEAD/DEAH box helicase [Candidatus Accumulibacter contiguus]NMQ06835.1 DEAD/DEAH box helicase [Candidatus Accumulibacter contiguus]
MAPETRATFEHLAPPLQRWLYEQGWSDLRPAQAEALLPILEGRLDVVIAAATASGKTEAAFLPLLTRLWQGGAEGVLLYVAPMKALINDQRDRLSVLCERLGIAVYPWHGDIGDASRKRFVAAPRGVVLITPESLESLLFRRGAELSNLFGTLEAVVVDELHAFIASERGRQLQSLLHRLEAALGRRIQRVGLSATLGDMGMAADFLRLDEGQDVRVIASTAETKSLRLVLKAVSQPANGGDTAETAHTSIATSLLKRLRDANYLIFPNSTGMVEFYADTLRRLCETTGLPVTFLPHHGRLGKTERESTEFELKRGNLPVSAICTSTLEMGIDIGAIRGVVQIGAPESVASLCQRIGRAGRREGEAAELWQYCVTEELAADSGFAAGLHDDLLQSIAVIRLFLAKWYEPPPPSSFHYSTLVQQILSLIGERCGVTAAEAYRVLCVEGPFRVAADDFIELLRSLAANELIMQDSNRVLLHGRVGERRVNHFTFFAAFQDTREYRLRHAGKELGTLPLKRAHGIGDALIFAGRRWQIAQIDHDKLRVELIVASTGKLPRTGGSGMPVHDRVRKEMRMLLAGTDYPEWLDDTACEVLTAARCHYNQLNLSEKLMSTEGRTVSLFAWRGDATQDALVWLLRAQGLTAENMGICLRVRAAAEAEVSDALAAIATAPLPDPADILQRPAMGAPEKWDWALPDRLFFNSFASRRLNLAAARDFASKGI